MSLSILSARREDAKINSIEDKDSIKMLVEETARCFDHEKVRWLYIAAQVRCIDLKVDLAVSKTMQIYKRTLKSAAAVAAIPLGNTANQVTVAVVICNAVVNAFGVPSVTAATVQHIVKNIVWDGIGRNFNLLMADVIATAGAFGTLCFGGVIPLFLVSAAVNMPLVIPATAQSLLMLSCDIILILVRAFKDCTHQCLGQPLKKDIEKAAVAYRPFATRVHQEIKELTDIFNIGKIFQAAKIQIDVQQIINKYTKLFVEESGTGAGRVDVGQGSESTLGLSLERRKSLMSLWSA